MDGEIKVDSGVSWLHDTLRQHILERGENLKEKIACGLPQDEYRQMVGRYRETLSQESELDKIFKNFYQSDDAEGDLEEME